MTVTTLANPLQAYYQRFQDVLPRFLPATDVEPVYLHQAMHYAVLNGGKRIRPLLVYATAEIYDLEDEELLDRAAVAVELMHCYSLVHDDLPGMDNDDLRRGKPTCHKAFDEATAILVSDALQALAFKILTDDVYSELTANKRLQLLRTLALAVGTYGMVGGQSLDLRAVGKTLKLTQLQQLHRMKTGALIRASIILGGTIACNGQKPGGNLERFADKLGLAFQIKDDILDVESSTAELGKQQGADQKLNKPTYVSILGIEEAKKHLKKMYDDALSHLANYGERANSLRLLAEYVVTRQF